LTKHLVIVSVESSTPRWAFMILAPSNCCFLQNGEFKSLLYTRLFIGSCYCFHRFPLPTPSLQKLQLIASSRLLPRHPAGTLRCQQQSHCGLPRRGSSAMGWEPSHHPSALLLRPPRLFAAHSDRLHGIQKNTRFQVR